MLEKIFQVKKNVWVEKLIFVMLKFFKQKKLLSQKNCTKKSQKIFLKANKKIPILDGQNVCDCNPIKEKSSYQ